MALTTFGAVMGFGSEMVGRMRDLFRRAAEEAKDPGLKETLLTLAKEDEKNYSLLEQARRENVTEMILEPIAGLQEEDYAMDLSLPGAPQDRDLLRKALALLERERAFFEASSNKMPLPEVARIFRKLAQKKERNLAQVKSIGLNRLLEDVSKV
jgi:hypothetical protein